MRVVSLFSGCGGLDFGFQEEGYNLIWANDFLADACSTYENNIGEHIVCKDILEVEIDQIPKADIIIGGPPCQSFSLVGKRDPEDDRGALVWRYLDIVKEIRPKIFVMENVTGIKSAKNKDGSRVLDNLVKAFSDIGYHIDVHTLNAANYGVPQKRRRVFIIGNRIGKKITAPPPTHTSNPEQNSSLPKWVSSKEALSDLGSATEEGPAEYVNAPESAYQVHMRKDAKSEVTLHQIPYSSEKDQEIIRHVTPGGNYMDVPDNVATTRILNFKKTGGRTTTYGRLDPEEPGYTLNTYFSRPNVGCNIHYSEDRLITLREGLRLQSFPDKFTVISNTKRNYYVQIGNAVPPLLAKSIAKHLKKYLDEKIISK